MGLYTANAVFADSLEKIAEPIYISVVIETQGAIQSTSHHLSFWRPRPQPFGLIHSLFGARASWCILFSPIFEKANCIIVLLQTQLIPERKAPNRFFHNTRLAVNEGKMSVELFPFVWAIPVTYFVASCGKSPRMDEDEYQVGCLTRTFSFEEEPAVAEEEDLPPGLFRLEENPQRRRGPSPIPSQISKRLHRRRRTDHEEPNNEKVNPDIFCFAW